MFQTGFPSVIRSSKLHIQRQVFFRPLLLPAASLARLAAGSSTGLTNACAVLNSLWCKEKPSETCRASYRNKLWIVASCWLYSANILAIHGHMNGKITSLHLRIIFYGRTLLRMPIVNHLVTKFLSVEFDRNPIMWQFSRVPPTYAPKFSFSTRPGGLFSVWVLSSIMCTVLSSIMCTVLSSIVCTVLV